MNLPPFTEPVPLSDWGDGAIRVGNTRITLDIVLAAYNKGAAPETIVEDFPTLDLAGVYLVIGYYLRHRSEVDQYLAERQVEADELRRVIEQRYDPTGIRERLLARLTGSSE